ncbi:MAG: hypothetical protein CME26_08565 [Gemmatimonadetes bacterium]|nr:hypothetical protein [Gemmatimonadota bacterium]
MCQVVLRRPDRQQQDEDGGEGATARNDGKARLREGGGNGKAPTEEGKGYLKKLDTICVCDNL